MYELEDYQPALYWPAFVEWKPLQRVLCYYEGDLLTDELGHRTVVSPADLPDVLFSRHLLCFVSTLTPYLPAFLERGAVIACNKDGLATSACFKYKRSTRWVILASQWGYSTASLALLQDLRELFTHLDCGTPNTPGATGQAVMRRAWREAYGRDWHTHSHQRPNPQCCADLYRNSTGARNELVTQDKHFPFLVELDEKNSYTDKLREEPSGPAVRFWAGCIDQLKIWVGRVWVTIREKLKWGPFPLRNTETKELTYPTEPGRYLAWLWSNEAQLAREEGCHLEIQDGWGWLRTTDDAVPYIDLASHLRDTAPDKRTEDLWKVCMVAAIGRHGMKPDYFELVEERLSPDDRPLEGEHNGVGVSTEYFVHAVHDDYPHELPHWMQYALARCRETIYRQFKPWREREMLVGVNTDAGLLRPEAEPLVLAHYQPKGPDRHTGEYGYRKLTPKKGRKTVTIPYNRGVISAEKTKLPGGAKEESIPDG